MLKEAIFYILVVSFTGCAQTPKAVPLLSGGSLSGEPVCLDERSRIPHFFEQFYRSRDLSTEEGKIEYLIERVRSSKLTFYRNNEKHQGETTAQFLRWKLNRLRTHYHIEIKTAEAFIEKAAAYSRSSGNPYVVEIPDAGQYPLAHILRNELDALRACLQETHEKAA